MSLNLFGHGFALIVSTKWEQSPVPEKFGFGLGNFGMTKDRTF